VSYLRFIAADYQDDQHLVELIEELHVASPVFGRLWQECHEVGMCGSGELRIDHVSVGPIDLRYSAADLHNGDMIKIYHVEPDTASDAAMSLLATAAASRTAPTPYPASHVSPT
jgi:hypothetical protein